MMIIFLSHSSLVFFWYQVYASLIISVKNISCFPSLKTKKKSVEFALHLPLLVGRPYREDTRMDSVRKILRF